MRIGLKLFAFAALLACLWVMPAAAQACPMCNQSIAEEDLAPHAFMYSIIFMLSMPATVFTGIGTAIYLKFRNNGAAEPNRAAGDELAAADDPA